MAAHINSDPQPRSSTAHHAPTRPAASSPPVRQSQPGQWAGAATSQPHARAHAQRERGCARERASERERERASPAVQQPANAAAQPPLDRTPRRVTIRLTRKAVLAQPRYQQQHPRAQRRSPSRPLPIVQQSSPTTVELGRPNVNRRPDVRHAIVSANENRRSQTQYSCTVLE